MIPYIEQPVLDLGFHQIEAFSILVLIAIVVQFQITIRRAPKVGIEPGTASALLGWAIGLGLVGAHVFDMVVYFPERLAEDPLVIFRIWDGLSSFGGMLGGLLGLFVVMRRKGMSGAEMIRFVDCLIFALPFTLMIGRAGCALLHDHPGISSTHWLAVSFPDGPRFDLGLLEFLYLIGVSGLFTALGWRRWPDGFFIGLFFAVYGPARFVMDSLRVSEVRYAGWTPGQYLALTAALGGFCLLLYAVLRTPPTPEAGREAQAG